MFDQTFLFTLLLGPVLAYVAGALVFSAYAFIQADQTLVTPCSNSNCRNGH